MKTIYKTLEVKLILRYFIRVTKRDPSLVIRYYLITDFWPQWWWQAWVLFCKAWIKFNQKVFCYTHDTSMTVIMLDMFCKDGHYCNSKDLQLCMINDYFLSSNSIHGTFQKFWASRDKSSWWVSDWFLCVPWIKYMVSLAIRSYQILESSQSSGNSL